MKSIWKACGALSWMLVTACGPAAGEGPGRAQVVFADNCAPCHGAKGDGNYEIRAPKIAGLPSWYVKQQLTNYREGIRGAHAEDLEGLRMRPMSRTIYPDDIDPIAEYVASMAVPEDKVAATGDSGAGQAGYATCAACHGQDGKGNEALHAPPISNLEAWYIEAQLYKFKNGIRGKHPKDKWGATMAPMAATLKDDAAVQNVAAYITTL